MPGFVKTPKDEARWAKAKEAAGKQAKHGSESFWKLSNYIYHKMGKTEQDAIQSKIAYEQLDKNEKLSIENLKDFSVKDMPAQQSIVGNEVTKMSEEKKYSAKEAAIAVLQKAEEILNKSIKGVHAPSYSSGKDKGQSEAGDATRQAASKGQGAGLKSKLQSAARSEHKAKLGELKAMPKPNLTKNDEIPHKSSEEKDATPSDNVEEQKAPQDNPAEQKEGNNPPAGDAPGAQANMGQPGLKGHLKLAKFIGYCHAKRKKPAAPQGAM